MVNKDEILVVLTTAPAGLGHIRVMGALKESLPEGIRCVELGVDDPTMQLLHRLTSINPQLRRLMEAVQDNPVLENGFTHWYRKWLDRHSDDVADELAKVVTGFVPKPAKLLIVATHAVMAYQLAQVKRALVRRLGMTIILAVVVTDDTIQKMWAVAGSDVTYVPSETTKAGLSEYFQAGDKIPDMVVVPYPVCRRLSRRLSEAEASERFRQLDKGCESKVKVAFPISGAAVQLGLVKDLIMGLERLIPVEVKVICRRAKYTQEFILWGRRRPAVTVLDQAEDREVVESYINLYEEQVIGLEVTKPSEQAFKVLYRPNQRGGAILLFSEPVGKQERDNLAFLRRHQLLPDLNDQESIAQMVRLGRVRADKELLSRARSWRGLILPEGGRQAAKAIWIYRQSGILAAMADFIGYRPGHEELDDQGAVRIWADVLGRVE